MTALTLWLEGFAFWAPALPGWDLARAVLRGEAAPQEPPARRPAPTLLPPAERRRASDSVALALEVAAAAVAASGRDAATLPSVFASAHGDLAINDHLCSMLAATPTLISPTRFHNSVHNAPAGYWTMATGCHEASTAITAFDASFANGLLLAGAQALADARPVLLAAYDVPAVGALASVTRSEGWLGVALVLAPEAGPRSQARLTLTPGEAAGRTPLATPAAQALAGNAMADALPLAEALAREGPAALVLPLSPRQSLRVALDP